MENTRILSPKQRRARNREEMIAAISQTARDVMREQGVAALNLTEIARRLGMQTPSLYEYFPNKMAIYDHLFRIGTSLYRAWMAQQTLKPDLSPWEQIEQSFVAHLQFAIDNPDLFKLLFERHVPGFVPSDESMAEMSASLAEANQKLQLFINAVQRDPSRQIEPMRDLFIALMHGIASQHLANNPDLPIGSGRFGSLIPLAIDLLKNTWEKETD